MSAIKGTKNDSGAEKRKRKKTQEKQLESQKGSICKYLKVDDIAVMDNAEAEQTEEKNESTEIAQMIALHHIPNISSDLTSTKEHEPVEDDEIEIIEKEIKSVLDDNSETIDWNDIGCWTLNFKNSKKCDFLVKKGPMRIVNHIFPLTNGRRFSVVHYNRKLSNCETLDRRWLVYSIHTDKAFCFCCKIFSNSVNAFSRDGYDNWKNFPAIVSSHETSSSHINSQKNWIELENRLNSNQTIDLQTQKVLNSEKLHWRGVLERLIEIIQFLAQRNLAFRGTDEKLNTPNNGNFLGLVQLVAKFDPVLLEHCRRINNNETNEHYLGNIIQNELIQLISSKVLKEIMLGIKNSKYYTVLLDCTPDISHQEQMTVILRLVEIKKNTVNIVERFVGFLQVQESTEVGLTEAILKKLNDLGLLISDCRGQGYDNGANMKGCNKGVQAKILEINKRAFFVPCGCHSLNLLLSDMARSSVVAKNFFGIVQQIYVLFSASVQRWQILKNHVKSLTVKPLSDTRWECKVDSVKAIRYQIGDIYDALVEISETANDPKCRTEAISLTKAIRNYTFLVTLCVWYEILSQVNVLSKIMQSDKMEIDNCLKLLKKVNKFLVEFKEIGFDGSKISAKELAEELEMSTEETMFSPAVSIRRKRTKKKFSYEAEDESIHDPEEKFRISFFNVLMDQAVMSLNERFEQLTGYQSSFGFLFNISDLKYCSDENLREHCMKLSLILSASVSDDSHQLETQSESDIEELNLFTELKSLAHVSPDNGTPLEVIRFIYNSRLQDVFPNVTTALRILLTIPITVASAERSFSKLKLIKTYLRSTMTQNRLVGLAQISIENDIASELDYSALIDDFANMKARKLKFT